MYCDHEDAPCCGCQAEMSADAYYGNDPLDSDNYDNPDDYGMVSDLDNCANGDHGDTDGTDAGWECVHCGDVRPYSDEDKEWLGI